MIQFTSEDIGVLLAAIDDFETALKNENTVMLQLQSRIDAQNDHIRLLRNEVNMWQSRAEYKDPADAEV